jgi:hypothetical protein
MRVAAEVSADVRAVGGHRVRDAGQQGMVGAVVAGRKAERRGSGAGGGGRR